MGLGLDTGFLPNVESQEPEFATKSNSSDRSRWRVVEECTRFLTTWQISNNSALKERNIKTRNLAATERASQVDF